MKKWISLLLALCLLLALAACGNDNTASYVPTTTQQTDNASTETDSAASSEQAETAATTETVQQPDTATTVTETPAVPEVPARPSSSAPILPVGETASTDTGEFFVEFVNITNDVLPPNPDNWYSHYEADEGKQYVDLCVGYKNTDTSDIKADKVMTGKLIYAGKYEYDGFSIVEEDSRTDLTYSSITNIAPLTTEYVHYLFKVPVEVADSANSILLEMNIGGSDYRIVVRESDHDVDPNAGKTLGKTSGDVVVGETVVTKNAEFYVDFANITKDVLPPKPGNYYSHYEADAGKTYVDFCVAYKNLTEKGVDADETISADLKYANKYDYTGSSMIEEDSRGDFTYSNITEISPLTTEYVHYLFEVPDEVANSAESIVITFTIDGNEYSYTVR